MSLSKDGRVTIPVDLDECKVELLGDRHSVRTEAWVLAMIEEIGLLRIANALQADRFHELERAQFVSRT